MAGWLVQGFYTPQYGWEDLAAYDSRAEALEDLAAYREAEPEYRHRVVREKSTDDS